jgi:hypothetical protein
VAKLLSFLPVPAGRLLPSAGGAGQHHETEAKIGEGKRRVHLDGPGNQFDVAMRDSGSDVNWSGATYYCQTLSLGGLAAAEHR